MRVPIISSAIFAIAIAAPAPASYLHADRARQAAHRGALYFRGSDIDTVTLGACWHGRPAHRIVYCRVLERGPAITQLGWDTMDYTIAVIARKHRPELVVNGGYTVTWREPR